MVLKLFLLVPVILEMLSEGITGKNYTKTPSALFTLTFSLQYVAEFSRGYVMCDVATD